MKKVSKRNKIKRLNLWRSYSDMMCGLLLLFILVMAVALFNTNQEYKQKTSTGGITSVVDDIYSQELTDQATTIATQQASLTHMQESLEDLQATVESDIKEMTGLKKDLTGLQLELQQKESELNAMEVSLTAKEKNLNALRTQLREAKDQISSLIGVQSTLVEELRVALKEAGINVKIDPKTGALILDSNVLFAFGSAELAEEGKELLAEVMPVYLATLLSDQFYEYMSEVKVNGYTDNVGTYEANLVLSQQRATSVVTYILSLDEETMPEDLKERFRNKVGVIGHSFSNLIMNDDGTVNADASRRVEVTFSLVDEEMVDSLLEALDNSQEVLEETEAETEAGANETSTEVNELLVPSTEMEEVDTLVEQYNDLSSTTDDLLNSTTQSETLPPEEAQEASGAEPAASGDGTGN